MYRGSWKIRTELHCNLSLEIPGGSKWVSSRWEELERVPGRQRRGGVVHIEGDREPLLFAQDSLPPQQTLIRASIIISNTIIYNWWTTRYQPKSSSPARRSLPSKYICRPINLCWRGSKTGSLWISILGLSSWGSMWRIIRSWLWGIVLIWVINWLWLELRSRSEKVILFVLSKGFKDIS